MYNIIQRLRLRFTDQPQLREQLRAILGFWPGDIKPYMQALKHRGGNREGGDNERLEFLGDAILSAVTADVVYHHFQEGQEGLLTKARSRMVSRETLNRVAHDIGLERLLRNVVPDQLSGTNVGGNALEALMGAVYLDRGYEGCQRFVRGRLLHRFINVDDAVQQDNNYKSRLLEFCQKRRLALDYVVEPCIDRTGQPAFRATVMVAGKERGTGMGLSKKAATQNAAAKALAEFERRGQKRRRKQEASGDD